MWNTKSSNLIEFADNHKDGYISRFDLREEESIAFIRHRCALYVYRADSTDRVSQDIV